MTETRSSHDPARQDPFAVISEVLDLVRLNGPCSSAGTSGRLVVSIAEDRRSLAGTAGGHRSLVMFHIVAEGHCWVALEDGSATSCSRAMSS